MNTTNPIQKYVLKKLEEKTITPAIARYASMYRIDTSSLLKTIREYQSSTSPAPLDIRGSAIHLVGNEDARAATLVALSQIAQLPTGEKLIDTVMGQSDRITIHAQEAPQGRIKTVHRKGSSIDFYPFEKALLSSHITGLIRAPFILPNEILLATALTEIAQDRSRVDSSKEPLPGFLSMKSQQAILGMKGSPFSEHALSHEARISDKRDLEDCFLPASPEVSHPLGFSWIHMATANGDLEGVRIMLENNPELINKKSRAYGRTPLMWAIKHDQRPMVNFLINKGADVDSVPDMFGRTAKEYLRENPEVLNY